MYDENAVTNMGPNQVCNVYVNGNYKVGKNASFTLGFKIPLMDANKKENGLALPMDYQSSLGTFDLVFGVGYAIKKLQLLADSF